MISAVGSPIGESDAVLAVASAQLVFASKVCFGSPDFACRMNMGGYGLIPYFKRYVRGLCKMTEEMQTESDYFPLGSTASVCMCMCARVRGAFTFAVPIENYFFFTSNNDSCCVDSGAYAGLVCFGAHHGAKSVTHILPSSSTSR